MARHAAVPAAASAVVIFVAVCMVIASTDWVRPEQCLQPAEVGMCEALFYRHHYNSSSDECERFVYGGCGGNANNFETKDECEQTCKPPSSDE